MHSYNYYNCLLNINLTNLFIEIDSCETNNNIFLVLEIFNDKE